MWTNVFKIGGLHHLSWFQLLPNELDLSSSLADKSVKLEQKDVATWLVLSSHLHLQKKGFLSTWTNSFVGPWDPSQGLHNPDEKIKLWLFLPGRHSSIIERAQAAVTRLRVVASGVWVAPGDSEEVTAAFSQSLRNCIERALIGRSYMRFGEVFSKYQPSQTEGHSRRGQPTVEFIFAATEEAIFIHVIISAKNIKTLSSNDVERALKRPSNHSSYRLPVIVAPHGLRGWLTGYCPSDLVKQVYLSSGKFRTSNGLIGLPYHVSQGPGCQLKGQSSYVEVTLGSLRADSYKTNANSSQNFSKNHVVESATVGRGDQKGPLDHIRMREKTFIYPVESVVVPALQTSFSRSSLKRFWLQNWTGPSLIGTSFFMHCGGDAEFMEGSWLEFNGINTHNGYNSSSNSNNSSISSVSSSSSDSDHKMMADLDADADSLSCRQSGLSSNDLVGNEGPKSGSKRPRAGMMGAETGVPMQDFGSDSAITGVANDQMVSHWDWDDDRGIGMDIQALLSEFGDFGDFFENDTLPFGEPPGTAESQALIFTTSDVGEVGSSPIGAMDVEDQMLLPAGFPSFDSFNPSPAAATDECLSKNQEATPPAPALAPVDYAPPPSTGEFDHLIKAEALMTFAPEYGAIETPASELSTSIFGSPYCPKSRKVDDLHSSPKSYSYGASPPSSTFFDGADEKTSMLLHPKMGSGSHDLKRYYAHVESRTRQHDRPCTGNDSLITSEGLTSSQSSISNSRNAAKSVPRKIADGILGVESILLPMRTVLATDIDCIMFQAVMCRIRHTLLPPSNPTPLSISDLSINSILNQQPGDASTMTDNISCRYEVKKEPIPVRIAGDTDGGVLDGHLNAPVGVWRPVGGPKMTKPTSSPSIEVSSSMPQHGFSEEGILPGGQRQPLQDLLDGMFLLVQQATSFVDVAFDSDCNNGPFGWLALQEQWRRGFCCGPSMIHAGCGGTLASSHSLDIAGVELVDPLSADIHPSSVISLLQSDIKTALKSAFENLEGPLSVTDWCKGRNLSGDGTSIDGPFAESNVTEGKECSSAITLAAGEPISPAQSSASISSFKVSSSADGVKIDEAGRKRSNQEIETEIRLRPTLCVLPSPAILVGYQDDWLKTSASSLQLWEKAPFEPYALPKPITYCVICPDSDPLTSAAGDFFQQLETVYEACKLGTHSPYSLGNQMEVDTGKSSTSSFILLDSPQSMKIESNNASLVGSLSDYFLSLSNGWDLTSYLKSLSKALKALKASPFFSSTNAKDGNSSPCMVIYVVCPFPEPAAVLQTVIESSVAIGSVLPPTDRERRSRLLTQVSKALSSSAAVDEASTSNVIVLSGFSVPKLVLQIVTVDAIFRVTSPSLSELVLLKEIAFTVYNKTRRISKGSSSDVQLSSRSHSTIQQMVSVPSIWKDSVGSRIGGPSLPREAEIESTLRPGPWDNSWQTIRPAGLSSDPNRNGDDSLQDDLRFMFEPLFILAEPGSLDNAVSPPIFSPSESSKMSDDNNGGNKDTISNSQTDGSDPNGFGSSNQKGLPSLHCCYGWTEDWRWLVSVWTDSRGELLDSHIFPFGGISSRQDTKGLQCLFAQVLQQGCQILQTCSSSDVGTVKPRDFVITRIGSFFELEYLEWQKAIFSVGGSEVKKWPLQLRRSMMPDGMSSSNNGASLQQQDISLIQERTIPSSPGALYSPHSKGPGFMKGGLGQTTGRKQFMGTQTVVDNSRGLLQWVQSISFATISIDHSLQLVLPADLPSTGGSTGANGGSTSGYLEGFAPVKSPGSTTVSYMLIPSPKMRFLPSTPLQLPTCLTAESPPLAHLLHSKGPAIPLSTGFIVSKSSPSMKKDYRTNSGDEWPSILSVSLIEYYGGNNINQEKAFKGISKQTRDFEIDGRVILEAVTAELHALSWMSVSPAYLDRRSALPLHCDMVLRLRRLLHFADKELSSLQHNR